MLMLDDNCYPMGDLVNGPRLKVVAGTSAAVVSALAVSMPVNLGAEAVGVDPFGALRG